MDLINSLTLTVLIMTYIKYSYLHNKNNKKLIIVIYY